MLKPAEAYRGSRSANILPRRPDIFRSCTLSDVLWGPGIILPNPRASVPSTRLILIAPAEATTRKRTPPASHGSSTGLLIRPLPFDENPGKPRLLHCLNELRKIDGLDDEARNSDPLCGPERRLRFR
jgi:hypothetical protein